MAEHRVQQCVLNMKPQIISLREDDALPKHVILISGLIISIWTICIFTAGCAPYGLRSTDWMIIITAFISHAIVALAATRGVQIGLKQHKPVFLKPWMILKAVEGIFLFLGCIFCALNRWTYVGLTPVGIILLMVGVYITMCVYTTYKAMMKPPVDPPSVVDHPPAYDSFTNLKVVT